MVLHSTTNTDSVIQNRPFVSNKAYLIYTSSRLYHCIYVKSRCLLMRNKVPQFESMFLIKCLLNVCCISSLYCKCTNTSSASNTRLGLEYRSSLKYRLGSASIVPMLIEAGLLFKDLWYCRMVLYINCCDIQSTVSCSNNLHWLT